MPTFTKMPREWLNRGSEPRPTEESHASCEGQEGGTESSVPVPEGIGSKGAMAIRTAHNRNWRLSGMTTIS